MIGPALRPGREGWSLADQCRQRVSTIRPLGRSCYLARPHAALPRWVRRSARSTVGPCTVSLDPGTPTRHQGAPSGTQPEPSDNWLCDRTLGWLVTQEPQGGRARPARQCTDSHCAVRAFLPTPRTIRTRDLAPAIQCTRAQDPALRTQGWTTAAAHAAGSGRAAALAGSGPRTAASECEPTDGGLLPSTALLDRRAGDR